jgi:hypothetical protein
MYKSIQNIYCCVILNKVRKYDGHCEIDNYFGLKKKKNFMLQRLPPLGTIVQI